MENLYNLNDIDMLPGFVSRNGKYGKLKISRDGNLWIINYSNFKELLTSRVQFFKKHLMKH